MAEHIADARERLEKSLQSVVTETESLLKAAGRDGSEQFNLARTKLERQLVSAKDELAGLQHTVAERARAAARTTDEAAHRHPWATAGIAAGIGAALGLLLGALIGRR